jgi:hypothetical protein
MGSDIQSSRNSGPLRKLVWECKMNKLKDSSLSKHAISSKIWGFHGGDYDDYHLLGDDAVWLL